MINSIKKRGQTMAIFLLLGLVLVAVVGFMLFLREGMKDTGIEDVTDLALSTTSFKAHAHQCLKQEVLNAVDKYGVLDGQEPYIGAHVRRNLPKCIEWDFYEEQGFAITAGRPAVQVEITRDTLLVDVEYLIEGQDQRGQFSFEELYFYLPRGASGVLAFDGADRTKDEVTVSSTDGDAELIIPKGTELRDDEGNLIEEVKLRVLERDFNGLANPLLVGMVAYEITPHVTFSQPVTLKMTYREEDIPAGVDESTLRLAQFERNYNMWFSVPTDVDEEKNTLTASFTHFSATGAMVRCGDGEPSARFDFPVSQLFPSGEAGSQNYVFIQDCGTIEECEAIKAVDWVTDDGSNLFENHNLNIGELLLKPLFEDDELVDPEKPYNQVPLSSCMINDWDNDDQIDTVEQVSPICIVGGESVDLSQCADPDNNLLLEECLGMIPDADKMQERIDALKEQEEKAGREVPKQDGIVDNGGCEYAINEEGNKADIQDPVFAIPATVNTYGYRGVEGIDGPHALPGGFGVLRFRFAGNGATCIALDENQKPLIELDVRDDKERVITDWKLNPYVPSEEGTEPDDDDFIHLAAPLDINKGKPVEDFEVDPGDVKAAWDAWDTLEGGLDNPATLRYQETGYNEIYIKVENAEDACVQARVIGFTIHGAGIAFDVARRDTDRCKVTVQERINYLCGCDRSCAGASWVNTELGILASWRGEWNPTAESIVNGQTLLCHLDPNDAKMQQLYEIQPDWSPFGGCCAGGVCAEEMEMMSVMVDQPCTVNGVTACDYVDNQIVECTAGDDGETWQPQEGGDCGDNTCRIVGETAQCVGEQPPEITDMEGCTYVGGGPNFRLDSVTNMCYECYKLAEPTGQYTGLWWHNPDLDQEASPPCSARLDEGCEPVNCKSSSVCASEGGVYDNSNLNNWCRNREGGRPEEVCCQEEAAPDLCPAEGHYTRMEATDILREKCDLERNGRQNFHLCLGQEPYMQSIYCSRQDGGWQVCYDECTNSYCDQGAKMCADEVRNACFMAEGVSCVRAENCAIESVDENLKDACGDGGVCCELECDHATCRHFDMAKIDAGWPGICNNKDENPCGLECMAKNSYCLEPDKSDCSPTADVDVPGTLWETYISADSKCWECSEEEDEVQWHKLSSTERCGCSKFGEQYRIGEAIWFEDNTCNKCMGGNDWDTITDSEHDVCTKRCTELVTTASELPFPHYFYPGQTICDSAASGSVVFTCYVDETTGELDKRFGECPMGCKSTTLINLEDCKCPGGVCPECPRTSKVPVQGDQWELYRPPGEEKECYYCDDGRWKDSTAGTKLGKGWKRCFCDRGYPPDYNGYATDGTTVWFVNRDNVGECYLCEFDESSRLHEWVKLDDPATDCPQLSKCTYQGREVEIRGWLCVPGEDDNEQNIKQCAGNNNWAGEKVCGTGCTIGTIFDTDQTCAS